ncbi:hypothetical protein D3C71_1239620 [compost metagenome]
MTPFRIFRLAMGIPDTLGQRDIPAIRAKWATTDTREQPVIRALRGIPDIWGRRGIPEEQATPGRRMRMTNDRVYRLHPR